MDNTQFAELLMGIAKAQNAVIDAMERAHPGFKNTHAVPILTTAANVRTAVPRLQDLPSRILLRMQGRAAFDIAAIEQDTFVRDVVELFDATINESSIKPIN